MFSHVLSGLVSRTLIALCSRLSFQGHQHGKELWKVEIRSPFGLKSRFGKQPNIKDSGSMHLDFSVVKQSHSMCSGKWEHLLYIRRLAEQRKPMEPGHSCNCGVVYNKVLVSLPRSLSLLPASAANLLLRRSSNSFTDISIFQKMRIPK